VVSTRGGTLVASEESIPSFPECPLRLRNSTASIEVVFFQFNPDLILLKPLRNGKALPYSNWGGTDHEELRDLYQRRGSGSSILRKLATEASRLSDICHVSRLPVSPIL
jgi:hypothetical protein